MCCLYLELKENGEFLSKIIETKVFGKCQCAFEEQNLPSGFFLNPYFNGKKQLPYLSQYFGEGEFCPLVNRSCLRCCSLLRAGGELLIITLPEGLGWSCPDSRSEAMAKPERGGRWRGSRET